MKGEIAPACNPCLALIIRAHFFLLFGLTKIKGQTGTTQEPSSKTLNPSRSLIEPFKDPS